MYIVRWLMGHPIIAVWVLGAIAILLSMNPSNKGDHKTEEATTISHEIKSGQVAKEADHVSDTGSLDAPELTNNNHQAASAPEEDLATIKAEGAETSTVDSITQKTTESAVTASVDKLVPAVVAPAVKDVKDTTITSVKQANESIADTSANAVDTIASTVENTQIIVSTAVQQVKESLVEKPKNIVQTVKEAPSSLNPELQGVNNQVILNDSIDLAQTDSTAEILLMAREAYWNNGFDEAAELYIQLIKQNPNEMGYKGELGNVYWRQGYPKKAAELYSEIALPMIENGHSDRVANMVGFIGLFYPDRATTIHQRIISKKK